MADSRENGSSQSDQSTRRQFWAGIALISVIPILALCSLHSSDLFDTAGSDRGYRIVYLIVLVVGITGFLLLRRQPFHVRSLRSRLEDTVRKELPEKPLNVASPNDIEAIDHYLGVLITELKSKAKATEQEATRLQQQLFQAQKIESLSAMATGIAHDFNNCLAAISGNINIAARGLPESSARDHARQAEVIALRAVDLANQLLLSAGRGRLVPEKLDFSSLIKEWADPLKAAVPANIKLEYRLADNLPPITADREQIRQAVTSLVQNAAESYCCASGTVIVTTGSTKCDRDYLSQTFLDMNLPEDLYVYIEVSDLSTGITQDIQNRMFDPFFTTKIRGRGMGLPIVLGVARAHCAALRVQSEPGKGSTFRLLFQASRVPIDPL